MGDSNKQLEIHFQDDILKLSLEISKLTAVIAEFVQLVKAEQNGKNK